MAQPALLRVMRAFVHHAAVNDKMLVWKMDGACLPIVAWQPYTW
jgi:hypothetical protein